MGWSLLFDVCRGGQGDRQILCVNVSMCWLLGRSVILFSEFHREIDCRLCDVCRGDHGDRQMPCADMLACWPLVRSEVLFIEFQVKFGADNKEWGKVA